MNRKQGEDFRAAADRRLAALEADPYLAQKVRHAAREDERAATGARRSGRTLRRILVPILTLAICLTAGFTVVAKYSYFESFIGRFSPASRKQLYPVLETVAADGISMEVLTAVADPEATVLYLALRDTENRGRIDGSTAIAVGNGLPNIFFTDNSLTHYDQQQGTAVFRVVCQNIDPETVDTFSLQLTGIRSGESRFFSADVGLDLASAGNAPVRVDTALGQYAQADLSYGTNNAVNDRIWALLEAEPFPALAKNEVLGALRLPEWLVVEGAAVQDGLLRIRYRILDNMERHTAPVFTLYQNGVALYNLARATVGLEVKEDAFGHAEIRQGEAIFELPGGQLTEGMTLGLECLEYAHYSGAGWAVSFSIPPRDTDRVVHCNIPVKGGEITEIRVSPVSAIISGYNTYDPESAHTHVESPQFEVYLSAGKPAESYSSSTISRNDETCEGRVLTAFKLDFSLPIDPLSVEYVVINGEQYPLDSP